MPTEIQSKSILASLSFWGLVGSLLAPLLAHFGIALEPGSFATAAVQAASGLVGFYGIARRQDIRVLPKPAQTPFVS